MQGNPKLANLIRDVAGKPVGAAEKVKLLTDGVTKIRGITFTRVANVPGAEAVFRGAPIAAGPMLGRSPVLAVLEDGRLMKGFDKPHPFGKPYHVIDLGELHE